MFKQVRVNELARAGLRQRLFGSAQLTDDALHYVAAAGDSSRPKQADCLDDVLERNEKDEGSLW